MVGTRVDGSPDPEQRGLRADAERNRERVVKAAREVFAEQGLDASTNAIARRAGVGIATLFRRFPTREDLVAATFADKMTAYTAAIDEALADPDPWHGFCTYIERICQMQSDDRGFADVLTMTFPTAKAFEAERRRSATNLSQLLDRAKKTGRLRGDFVHQDVPLILMANAGVITATRDSAPDAWRRLVAYLIQHSPHQPLTHFRTHPPPARCTEPSSACHTNLTKTAANRPDSRSTRGEQTHRAI